MAIGRLKQGRLSLLEKQTGHGEGKETGSVSILIFGLFFLTMTLVLVLTDLSSMIVARRSLVSASENAVMQAAHILDRDVYYQGNSEVVVPLDCGESRLVAIRELDAWSRSEKSIRRFELSQIRLEEFYCSGDEVEIVTSAQFDLPFVLPNSQLQKFELTVKVGASSRRVD